MHTKNAEVTLKVSKDATVAKTFHDARLPVSLSEHSYTILDSSEDTVFLHVDHQPFSSSAYAGTQRNATHGRTDACP